MRSSYVILARQIVRLHFFYWSASAAYVSLDAPGLDKYNFIFSRATYANCREILIFFPPDFFYDNKKHSQKHLFTKDSQTRYLNSFCKQTHLVLICFLKEQTLLIINAKVIVFKVNRLNDGFCIFPYCFILNTIKTSSW